MEAQIGTIVHYRISQNDVAAIQQNRKAFLQASLDPLAHGNDVTKGEVYPAVIVREFGSDQVSLKVLLDGPDEFWATSKSMGDSEGQWQWADYTQSRQDREKERARQVTR